MIDRIGLLDKLDRVTDRAAAYAIRRGMPVQLSKKSILIGNTFIEKNNTGAYNVLGVDRSILYKDISVFDVAVIVAQKYNEHELGTIKKVLSLEERFSKYHTDMIHYLRCMKSAKKKNDTERMAILEDKFQLAEQFAKDIRDRISVFKRVK
jgi:hypothetical protein